MCYVTKETATFGLEQLRAERLVEWPGGMIRRYLLNYGLINKTKKLKGGNKHPHAPD